jgi:starvation-inducible outer membrane lipoprotein
MRKTILISSCVIFMGLEGCVSTPYDLTGESAPLEIRSVQTREYDALDKPMTMRAVIATLQDLGFTIDQADMGLGIVTATRLQVSDMRMTVTVAPKDEERVSVRANARVGEKGITQPETYQDFFVALDKAMFLVRNNVN